LEEKGGGRPEGGDEKKKKYLPFRPLFGGVGICKARDGEEKGSGTRDNMKEITVRRMGEGGVHKVL